MRVVLASKSPRRRELLKNIFSDFEIITSEVDESLEDGVHPRDGVQILAVRKGEAISLECGEDTLVISSDTLVEKDGEPLGKPSDIEDAVRMLKKLSGGSHNVHTGVAVHYKGRVFSGVKSTEVVFLPFNDKTIEDYVATGEPMDKAGSYAIQGLGGKLVSEYRGDFDTVVGLSVSLTRELVERAVAEAVDE